MSTPTRKKRSRDHLLGLSHIRSQSNQLHEFKDFQLSKRRLHYGDGRKKASSRFTVVDTWSLAEERALVEFILLNCDGTSWISTKKVKFWESASEFVYNICCVNRRTSTCKCILLVRQNTIYNLWGSQVSCLF